MDANGCTISEVTGIIKEEKYGCQIHMHITADLNAYQHSGEVSIHSLLGCHFMMISFHHLCWSFSFTRVNFNMSQVCTILTTLPMTFMCAGASTATMTLAVPSSSVGLPGLLGQQNELPLPPVILMDIMIGVSGFTTVLL